MLIGHSVKKTIAEMHNCHQFMHALIKYNQYNGIVYCSLLTNICSQWDIGSFPQCCRLVCYKATSWVDEVEAMLVS